MSTPTGKLAPPAMLTSILVISIPAGLVTLMSNMLPESGLLRPLLDTKVVESEPWADAGATMAQRARNAALEIRASVDGRAEREPWMERECMVVGEVAGERVGGGLPPEWLPAESRAGHTTTRRRYCVG